jgi:hypothetical protein
MHQPRAFQRCSEATAVCRWSAPDSIGIGRRHANGLSQQRFQKFAETGRRRFGRIPAPKPEANLHTAHNRTGRFQLTIPVQSAERAVPPDTLGRFGAFVL